jgi:glucan phosphoethanolaminetransferase (alkaline phosphatase superfamily)
MRKFLLPTAFALFFASWAVVVSRLLAAAGSPGGLSAQSVQEFFDHINLIPSVFDTNLTPESAGIGRAETIYWVLVFMQWFVVGLCLYLVYSRYARKVPWLAPLVISLCVASLIAMLV